MFQKNCIFCVLILGIVLFMGCGGQTTLPPSPPPGPLPLFSPVGSWEMVSMDGKPVAKYFALFGGNVAEVETAITQNDFVFFENGSWFWTLGLNIEAAMGGGLKLDVDMSLASQGSYTGSYTTSGGTMVIVQQDLGIDFKPEDFWASAGVSEEDFKKAVTRDWLFGKVENWEANFDGNMLTLTNTNGIEQVLIRK